MHAHHPAPVELVDAQVAADREVDPVEQLALERLRVAPGAVELALGEQDRLQTVVEDRLPGRGRDARGVLGAVVVQHHDALLLQRDPGHLEIPHDVLVQVGGVDVDEAERAGGYVPAGQDAGRSLDDLRQLVVEGEVVGLEGRAGQRLAVGQVHLGGVLVVGRVRVEEVADGERLAGLEVFTDDDRAAAEVGAHLQQVAGDTGLLLPPQEPVEGMPVVVPEPPLDIVQARRLGMVPGVARQRGVGHESSFGARVVRWFSKRTSAGAAVRAGRGTRRSPTVRGTSKHRQQ